MLDHDAIMVGHSELFRASRKGGREPIKSLSAFLMCLLDPAIAVILRAKALELSETPTHSPKTLASHIAVGIIIMIRKFEI